MAGQAVKHSLELLGGFFVTAVLHQLLGQMQVRQRVCLLIADGIVVGGDGFLCVVDAPVALCHLQGPLSAQGTLLGWRL